MLVLVSRADEIGDRLTGSSLSGRVLAPCALSRLVNLDGHAGILHGKIPKFGNWRMCAERAGSTVMATVIVGACMRAKYANKDKRNEIQRQRDQDID